jgi:hypothetical protein
MMAAVSSASRQILDGLRTIAVAMVTPFILGVSRKVEAAQMRAELRRSDPCPQSDSVLACRARLIDGVF